LLQEQRGYRMTTLSSLQLFEPIENSSFRAKIGYPEPAARPLSRRTVGPLAAGKVPGRYHSGSMAFIAPLLCSRPGALPGAYCSACHLLSPHGGPPTIPIPLRDCRGSDFLKGPRGAPYDFDFLAFGCLDAYFDLRSSRFTFRFRIPHSQLRRHYGTSYGLKGIRPGQSRGMAGP